MGERVSKERSEWFIRILHLEQILFDNKIVIESKASNQGILDVEDGVVWKSTKLGEK